MNTIFRERIIDGSNGAYSLKFKKISDIFNFDEPPYICAGSSGGGKTTIAIDIIYNFAKQASRVYYVSATKPAVDEQAINLIPEVYRRTPTYDNLSGIWNEIKTTCEQTKQVPDKLMNLLPKLYDKEDIKIITTIIGQSEKELAKTHDVQSITAWKLEVLTRIIVDAIQQRGHKNLTIEELSIVTNLISSQQKTILILDDVSSELSTLKSDKRKVMVGTNMISVAEAYKSVLTDILTKARHFQCLCVIFIHDWNIIEGKEQATNFIMLGSNSVSSISNKRSISPMVVEKAKQCAPIVFNSTYKYHFLVIKNNGESVCVSKADLHDRDKIEMDQLNLNLMEAYKNVTLGLTEDPLINAKSELTLENHSEEDSNNESESEGSNEESDEESSNESEEESDEESSEDNGLDIPI